MNIQTRHFPLIWIDPKALLVIRSRFNTSMLRNLYLSLCELESLSKIEFPDWEIFINELKELTGLEPDLIIDGIRQLNDFKLIECVQPSKDKPLVLFQLKDISAEIEKKMPKGKDSIDTLIPESTKIKKAAPSLMSKSSMSSADSQDSKPDKNPLVKEVLDYFYQQCYSIKGFKPEISGGIEGRMIKQKLKRYSPAEMKEVFDWFLESEESDTMGCTIKLCLSNYVFNKWLAQRAY